MGGFLFVPGIAEIGKRCEACPAYPCDERLDLIVMVQQGNVLSMAKGLIGDAPVPTAKRIASHRDIGCSFSDAELVALFAEVSGDETIRNMANEVLGKTVDLPEERLGE